MRISPYSLVNELGISGGNSDATSLYHRVTFNAYRLIYNEINYLSVQKASEIPYRNADRAPLLRLILRNYV